MEFFDFPLSWTFLGGEEDWNSTYSAVEILSFFPDAYVTPSPGGGGDI